MDARLYWPVGIVILVWPLSANHPSAIVTIRCGTFVTPLNISGMSCLDIVKLRVMIARGAYAAVWSGGHVTVRENTDLSVG